MRFLVVLIRLATLLGMGPGIWLFVATLSSPSFTLTQWSDSKLTSFALVELLLILGPYAIGNTVANMVLPMIAPRPAIIDQTAVPLPPIDLPV